MSVPQAFISMLLGLDAYCKELQWNSEFAV